MPAKLDSCVSSMIAKWKADPKSKPKPKKPGESAESMAFAICNASLKLEQEQERIMLEGVGPALVAAAITAKPHLRQRGKEVRIIEKDGQKLVEVPLMKKGTYRHQNGKLVFNDDFMDRMIENHRKKVTDYNVHLDFRHKENQGALAFLDVDDGGWLERKDDWLYAYGPVADEEAERIIASRKWRYASPDFYFNYESNAISHKLSADDLEEVDINDLYKEHVMEKVITLGNLKLTLQETDGVYTLEDASVLDQLQAVLKDLTDKAKLVDQLQARIAELEKNTQLEEPEIPEPLRLRLEALEAQNKELERESQLREAAFTLERAKGYRDEAGRGHSKVLLDLAEAGLMMKTVEQGEIRIQLESQDEAGIAKYYRGLIRLMLEKIPGQVPMDSRTEGTEVRLETSTNGQNFTDDELRAAIEKYHTRY